MRSSRILLFVLALLVAACGDDGEGGLPPLTSSDVGGAGAFGVGVTTRTFEDPSRATQANGSFPGAPVRRIVTEIWYPAETLGGGAPAGQRDAVLAPGGPYGLVIYSHGFMSMRTGGAYLARHLARHGYVVAAPDFPLTHFGAPGGAYLPDVVEQPGDVRFLIDTLLALSADPDSMFHGRIDPERIALAGLSLGGMTTSLASYHVTERDPRVRAAVTIAGPACFFDEGFYDPAQVPLLILFGDLDAIVAYPENGRFAFARASSPRHLATIAGGSHTGFTAVATSPIFAALDNPDDLGCQALAGGLPEDEEADAQLADLLGGAAAGIFAGDCPAACAEPPPLPPAIDASRQQDLAVLAVLSFLETYLEGRLDMRRFLEQTLSEENPEIRVETAR